MGSGHSQDEVERFSLEWYKLALNTCVLPDVSIDDSLVKFSGINSNAELQSYSNELGNSVPGYILGLGTAFGALTAVSNAVGLGALVISMILEIAMKSSKKETPDSYSLLRRVFGEEKASSVRDTMFEYLKRHRMNINDDQQLLVEIRIMERQLSGQLTALGNSLLYDRQMSTRGFKFWVNGASFHIQMLIHKARLDIQAGKPASDSAYKVKAAIDDYLTEVDKLLENFKTYMNSTTSLYMVGQCRGIGYCTGSCILTNTETKCEVSQSEQNTAGKCGTSDMVNAYINHVFSKYHPIISLRGHFSNIKNNVDTLIIQHDTFTLPSQ